MEYLLLFISSISVIASALVLVTRLLKRTMATGDTVRIYVNNRLNRTTTISKIEGDCVFIYSVLAIKVEYRGRFYAMSENVVIVPSRWMYPFALFAELLRTKLMIESECVKNLSEI